MGRVTIVAVELRVRDEIPVFLFVFLFFIKVSFVLHVKAHIICG